MRLPITLALIYLTLTSFAQQPQTDSTRLLDEIVIEAYETNRRMDEVPASVGLLREPEW